MLPTRLRMLLSIAPSPLLSGRLGASLLPLQVHQEISKSMKKALKNRSAFDFSLPSQPFPSTHNDKKKQQQTRLSLYLRPSLPRRAVSSVSAAMGGPPSHHRFSDAEMEASVALMKQQGIVDSGDALVKGIGAMNQVRIRDFYDQMVRAGLFRAEDIDLRKVSTDRFVNHGVGLDIKSRLLGH